MMLSVLDQKLLQSSHSTVGHHDCNHNNDVSVNCSESGIKILIMIIFFTVVVENVTVCSTEFDDQLWAAMR